MPAGKDAVRDIALVLQQRADSEGVFEAQGAVGEVALPEKDVNSSTSIEFDEEVPEELLDLNTVKFDGTPKLVIDIQFEAPEEVAKLELMDYVIHFPEFIVFDDNRIENHCLVIDGEMDVDAGYHVELDILQRIRFRRWGVRSVCILTGR